MKKLFIFSLFYALAACSCVHVDQVPSYTHSQNFEAIVGKKFSDTIQSSNHNTFHVEVLSAPQGVYLQSSIVSWTPTIDDTGIKSFRLIMRSNEYVDTLEYTVTIITEAEADTTKAGPGPLLSDFNVVMGLAQYCSYRNSGFTMPCFTEEKINCTPPFSSSKLKYDVFIDKSFYLGILPSVANDSVNISVALDSAPCGQSYWNERYWQIYSCGPTSSTKIFKIAVSDSSKVQNVYTLTVNRK